MKRSSLIVCFLSMILLQMFAQRCFGATAANAPVPPMGWNSWNYFGCDGLNEDVVMQTAAAMVSSGMQSVGYSYIVLDDCWMATARDANGALVPDPDKFPDGMPALVNYVHGLGLKFGLYEDAGTATCQGRPGSYGYYDQDAATFASWGIDYIKVDWCNTAGMDPVTQYTQFAESLHAAMPGIVLSVCDWGTDQPWTWAPAFANLWRATGDIQDNWSSMLNNMQAVSALTPYSQPGAWNDPDMLEVGNGGMTDSEYRVHFTGWSMLAAPLIAGNDLAAMSSDTVATLTNSEVVAVDQDSLGQQGILLWDNGAGQEAWVRQVNNGTVVALMNLGPQASTISFDFGDIGINGTVPLAVRDLWNHANLGTWYGSFSATVASHDVEMIEIPVQAALPLPAVYEADASANLLSGQAAIQSCTACLDGNDVTGLGGSSQNTIAVNLILADSAADYYLTVYANLSGSNSYTYQLNNGGFSTMAISGSTTAFPSTSGAIVGLSSGENTIVFGNPVSSTAALDHISITPKAGVAPDFDIVFPVPAITIPAPGQYGAALISLAPLNGFNGAVVIQCSVPESMTGATCQGSTAVLGGANVTTATISIQTTGSAIARQSPDRRFLQPILALAAALPLALVRRARQRSKRANLLLTCLAAVFAGLFLFGCTGCGAGNKNGGSASTAAGTYSINITATSGAIVKSITCQAIVQ